MKSLILRLLVLGVASLTAVGVSTVTASAAEQKGICLVCKVKHGEAEPEPVKAVRTYEGKEYGFCSEKCAQEFALDPAAYVPADMPRLAPTFAFTDLAGKPLTSESLKGQVVLLDFWATWCMPCRKSMPELQALHDRYASRGLTVIGVSIDEGGPAKVQRYVRSKKFTYPIVMDDAKSPAWDAYKVKAIPAAFLLDREGRIVAQWTGSPANPRDLEQALEKLLAVD
jgi:peroxiredoxin/YHS domain-containing protein